MKPPVNIHRGRRTTRKLTIIAQDPQMRGKDGRILTDCVSVPAEHLQPGPTGHRVTVIDYDATADALYAPAVIEDDKDPYAGASDAVLLDDPRFHAQNVYAIVMRTLARFEFALGRRVPWGCPGHQIHVAPHAFAEPNAFYSREDRALFFGYFGNWRPGDKPKPVCTALSHDVVAHETTHAILDGLRPRYMEPSLPDQGAFHEGFADIVAMLSVFALPKVVSAALGGEEENVIAVDRLSEKALVNSALFKLAEEVGTALRATPGGALRQSVTLPIGTEYLTDPRYEEEHARGEIVVAAMMRSFLRLWVARLARIGTVANGVKDRQLVVEEGAKAADHLLTMAIRGIDYCPAVDLNFCDFVSAMLTADAELVPGDEHGYRATVYQTFADYGIVPCNRSTNQDGTWLRCDDMKFDYCRTHFDSMLRDPTEVFRFVWENRKLLEFDDQSYLEVPSVWPSTRVGPDGFVLRETVAEYIQILTLAASDLKEELGIELPADVPPDKRLRLYGGGTLIFDEYGQLKYHIAKHIRRAPEDIARQSERLNYLWRTGYFEGESADPSARLAGLHLARSGGGETA